MRLPYNQYLAQNLPNGQPRRFRIHGQAAGGHRPHRRRLRQTQESRGAKLLWTLPLPRRKDSRRSPSTPPGSSITASAAEFPETSSASSRKSKTSLFPKPSGQWRRKLGIALPKVSYQQSRGSAGSQTSHHIAGNPRTRLRIFPGMPAAPRRRACAENIFSGRGLDEETITAFRIGYRTGLRVSAARPLRKTNSTKNCCARAACSPGSRTSQPPVRPRQADDKA